MIIHIQVEGKCAFHAANALKRQLTERLPGVNALHLAVSPVNELILVAVSDQPIDIPSVRSALYRNLAHWQQQSQQEWYAFIGSLAAGQTELNQSYANARRIQTYELFLPTCSVVDCEGLLCRIQERTGKLTVRFDRLDHLLDQQDLPACLKAIDEFFSQLPGTAGLDADDSRCIISEVLLRIFNTRNKKFWRDYPRMPDYSEILRMNSLDDVKSLVIDAATCYITDSRQALSEHHPVIQKMLKHVENHYSEDISLKSLSNELHFNPSYLGQIFKQETSQLFTEYLCNFRIEKAKQLLLQGSCKSRDVAEKVGFQNANYFANVFKSRTGVYPTAFKKINSV